MVVALSAVPQSPEGFYAVNNQFLVNGPKGFMEFKTLDNDDMYVRIDLPGVPRDSVYVSLDQSTTTVGIFAAAPKEHKHDLSHRSYGTNMKPKLSIFGVNSGIVCKCCQYSGFTSSMSDGVLRLVFTKNLSGTERPPCIAFLGASDGKGGFGSGPHQSPQGTYPHDPNLLSGPVLMPHPAVSQGSLMAYESKQLQNGGLYVRADMPGVPKNKFTVSVTNGRVKVTGEAPALSHDSGGRFYSGDVAILSRPVDLPIRKIKTIAKNGVIRLIIPPV